MTVEMIEGEAHEVEPRALTLVPQQPGQSLVAGPKDSGPDEMIGKASHLASALARIVEAQNLYTMIQGKKYPQVEAWMTIGRMDNVVAREAGNPERHEDGSYEAVVELIRLSDGMVIGRGSALCGTKGDRPWDTRAEPARRSMAVTRATSRAFRQQYSWIMALAGYEPTPADEMPSNDERPAPPDPVRQDLGRPPLERKTHEPLIGTAEQGKVGSGADFEIRQTPDGPGLAFRLTDKRKGWKVIAMGTLAESIYAMRELIEGQRVQCWGELKDESFHKADQKITYQVLHLERIATPDFILPPAAEAETVPMGLVEEDLSELDF